MTGGRRRAVRPGAAFVAATYNVHSCIGVDHRYDPERVGEVLRELHADIIGLQEVDARHRFGRFVEQWSFFAEMTGLPAACGPHLRDHRGRFGNSLLTRFPVRRLRHVDLSVGGYEPRGAIDAELIVEGRPLRVVVTHLGLHGHERRAQTARLLAALSEGAVGNEAVLVMGDLNEWRGRRGGIPALDQRWGRAPAPRTFPSWLPLLPLDRIYAGGAAALHGVSVHRSGLARLASDHLPLRATVGWQT
jgi:endonuclease/exonuclease/phosphatase family metal-dependent hydrolase